MRNLFKFTQRMYTFNRAFRLMKIAFVVGMIAAFGITYYVVPRVTTAFAALTEDFNAPTVYEAPQDTETPSDRIELYYTEEYRTLEEKYEQMRQDEARINAIERVEMEFEEQKQEIRARELLL